jgi:hypothetical protein
MDEWNVGRMGLKEKDVLYIFDDQHMLVILTKFVSNPTSLYSNFPLFHHSNASATGYGK